MVSMFRVQGILIFCFFKVIIALLTKLSDLDGSFVLQRYSKIIPLQFCMVASMALLL